MFGWRAIKELIFDIDAHSSVRSVTIIVSSHCVTSPGLAAATQANSSPRPAAYSRAMNVARRYGQVRRGPAQPSAVAHTRSRGQWESTLDVSVTATDAVDHSII